MPRQIARLSLSLLRERPGGRTLPVTMLMTMLMTMLITMLVTMGFSAVSRLPQLATAMFRQTPITHGRAMPWLRHPPYSPYALRVFSSLRVGTGETLPPLRSIQFHEGQITTACFFHSSPHLQRGFFCPRYLVSRISAVCHAR